MCLICIDLDRGALRPAEARRALFEMREGLPPLHVAELEQVLTDLEASELELPPPAIDP